MNKKLVSIFIILLVQLSACKYSSSVFFNETEQVVKETIDAWNAGDAASLKVLFADDATVCFPDWGVECTTGAEEIGAWIDELVGANFTIELESLEVEGDTVTVIAKVWADPTRELGVAPLITTDIYTVQDGKISSQTSTLTEESSAKLMFATQNAGIVIAFIEAINAGDIEQGMTFFDDETYVEMTPTLLSGFPKVFGRQDVIRTWLVEMKAVNLEIEIETFTVQRSTVNVKTNISSDYLQSLHVDAISVDDVFIIRDSKILSWTRTIPISSLNMLQDGLVEHGIPETINPEPDEFLTTEINEIIGQWNGMLTPGGEKYPIIFEADGSYELIGGYGPFDSGYFQFNGPFLWVISEEVLIGDTLHSCLEKGNIGSYVVYVTRLEDKPVELRLISVLDPCAIRADLIGNEKLTPK